MSKLKTTPADEFTRMRLNGVGFTLFSGRTIRMRSTQPTEYLEVLDRAPRMFQTFISKLIRLEDDGNLVDSFIELPEKPSEMLDLVTSLNIVSAMALLSPWMAMPELSRDNWYVGLGAAEAQLYAFQAGIHPAQTRAKTKQPARPPEQKIEPADLDFYEKRIIFQLAFLSEPVLYHLEQTGLNFISEDEQPAEAIEPVPAQEA